MSSQYCGTMPIKQGTNDEKLKIQMQISWDKQSETFEKFMCQMAQKSAAFME